MRHHPPTHQTVRRPSTLRAPALGLVWLVLTVASVALAQPTALTFVGAAFERAPPPSDAPARALVDALRDATTEVAPCAGSAELELVLRLRPASGGQPRRSEWIEGPEAARACVERALREVSLPPTSIGPEGVLVWWSTRRPRRRLTLESGRREDHGSDGHITSTVTAEAAVFGPGAWRDAHTAWLERHRHVLLRDFPSASAHVTLRVRFDATGRPREVIAVHRDPAEARVSGVQLSDRVRELPPDPALANQVWRLDLSGRRGITEIVQP